MSCFIQQGIIRTIFYVEKLRRGEFAEFLPGTSMEALQPVPLVFKPVVFPLCRFPTQKTEASLNWALPSL